MGNNCHCLQANDLRLQITAKTSSKTKIVTNEIIQKYEEKNEIEETIKSTQNQLISTVIQSKSTQSTKSLQTQKQQRIRYRNKIRDNILLDLIKHHCFADKVVYLEDKIKDQDILFVQKILQKHFITSQLNQKQIRLLVKKMRYCITPKETYIFKKGDESFSYYIIKKGVCQIEDENRNIQKLNSGDSFGDLGIIYNSPRSTSIYALDQCLFIELNGATFRQAIKQLNEVYEIQNKLALSKLQFYNDLTELQKNILAVNCVLQNYPSGQIIFKKGDEANSIYIVKEGIVTILQKKINFKHGESVGQNAILTDKITFRTCTLIAKTKCTLLSLNKNAICRILGNKITYVLKKNLVDRILNESDIKQMLKQQEWTQNLQNMNCQQFFKGDEIFKKGYSIQPGIINIILTSEQAKILLNSANSMNQISLADITSQTKRKRYFANSIIEPELVFKKKKIIFLESFFAQNDGFFIVLSAKKSKNKFKKDLELEQLQKHKMQQSSQIQEDSLQVIHQLGVGSFGEVYACYCTKNNKKYAVKVMNKKFIENSKLLNYVLRQQQVFKYLPPHPFIVTFYKMIENEQFFQIVLELIEGEDFCEVMYQKYVFHQNEKRFYIAQVILILEHLHKNHVIYRDLKPQNLIMGFDGYLKLLDMGTCKILTPEQKFRTSTIIGTPQYMAPEIISGKSYTFSSDLWSLGVLLYQFAIGQLPFGQKTEDPFKLYEQIISKEIRLVSPHNKSLKDLLRKLLNKSPEIRLGNNFSQFKLHSYFQEVEWQRIFLKKSAPYYRPKNSKKITMNQVSASLTKKSRSSSVFRENMRNRI